MITPHIDNPHLADSAAPHDPPSGDVGSKAKIRYLTYSPNEEYAVRDGETEALSPDFLAMLCGGWHGVATCTLRGVLVKNAELVGHANRSQGIRYHAPDSILCNQLAAGDQEVRYTFNPSSPSVIHLHTLKGEYVETLPAVTRIGFLDNAGLKAQTKKHQAQIQHAAAHLQRLHQEQSTEAVDRLSQNAAEMDRVANQIQLPEDQRPAPAQETPQSRIAASAERVMQQQSRRAELIDRADEIIETRRETVASTTRETQPAFDPFDL